ncbi:hypothetical protein HU200_040028 [Digitaria exilis]|uniref:Uncharacterized protein n=1 Tax=Digitaria exilis TaxID=1010633 RepID=A0A835B9M3_9POAL|nr:hypothetical protein HU200_040028 [Digitaria exilis]
MDQINPPSKGILHQPQDTSRNKIFVTFTAKSSLLSVRSRRDRKLNPLHRRLSHGPARLRCAPRPSRGHPQHHPRCRSIDDDTQVMPVACGGMAREPAKEAPRSGRALAYASSGDPFVDFFFQVIPGATSEADVAALHDVAWSRDARTSPPKGLAASGLDLLEILHRILHGDRMEDESDRRKEQHIRGQAMKRRRTDGEFEAAKDRRRQEETQLARYEFDEAFRYLYDHVAEMFAEMLKSATLLCEAIARRIFPRECSQEYLNISDKHYAYRVRDHLRREVLVPLRKALELPEVYMCACKFEELPYARVASVFQKHDKHRVTSFFDETLAAEGRLANCITVCGLSGAAAAVADQPASAAIALAMEGARDHLPRDAPATQGARRQPQGEAAAACGGHGGAQEGREGVFSRILQLAVAGGLHKDMMVKRVFVLSDMDFDGWTGAESVWKTEYQGICDKFVAEGFTVPQVVFWNVGTSKASMPVVAAQEGAALVSGYSKNLVRLFLEADGELTPAAVVADAISGPEYDALEVFD